MSTPTFSQVSWLKTVLAHEPEYYKLPVAYEFGSGATMRQFVRDDARWYETYGHDASELSFGDDYLYFGFDELRFE